MVDKAVARAMAMITMSYGILNSVHYRFFRRCYRGGSPRCAYNRTSSAAGRVGPGGSISFQVEGRHPQKRG
jgi:hypothetical protein